MDRWVFLAFVAGLPGLASIVAVVLFGGRLCWQWRTWTPTEAEVFRIDEKTGEAKLTFLDAGGRQRTAIRGWLTGRYTVGGNVNLRYDPANPFRNQLVGPIRLGLRLLGLLALAGLGSFLVTTAATSRNMYNAELEAWPWYASVVGGIVCIAVSGLMTAHQWKRRHWRGAEGTVTSARTRHVPGSDGGSLETRITYQFADTVTGRNRTGGTTTLLRSYQRGEAVSVRFDPAHPEINEIATRAGRALWLAVAAATLACGVLLVVVGLLHRGALAW